MTIKVHVSGVGISLITLLCAVFSILCNIKPDMFESCQWLANLATGPVRAIFFIILAPVVIAISIAVAIIIATVLAGLIIGLIKRIFS